MRVELGTGTDGRVGDGQAVGIEQYAGHGAAGRHEHVAGIAGLMVRNGDLGLCGGEVIAL